MSESRLDRLSNGVFDGWDRFWFKPTSTATLAIVRMAWGTLTFLWTLTLALDVRTFYGRDGLVPAAPTRDFRYGLFDIVESDVLAVAVVAVLLVSSLCVAVGFRTRLATVVTFVLLLTLWERNPWHFNGGDMLVRHIGFFLMFAPAGAALSLDRWRRDRTGLFDFPLRAPWALRLIQIQMSVLYLFTTWAKARGDRWVNGTAVGGTMRVDDLTRFDLPYWMSESVFIGNLLTYGTLVVELSLAILIWNRRLRPWVIAAGVGLHVFIDVTFSLGFFAPIIFVGYLSFIPEETAERWIRQVRDRFKRGEAATQAKGRPAPTREGAKHPVSTARAAGEGS